MEYELSNPSDRIYFDAASDEIATFCALFLSDGKYAAKREGWSSSFYIMGISEEELNRLFRPDIETFMKLNTKKINKCFQSFRYAHERTSTNKIVDRAHSMIIKG